MAVKKYPKEVTQHKNQWVALTQDDRIAGYGKTPEEAIASAEKSGFTRTQITLIYIPDEWPKLMML